MLWCVRRWLLRATPRYTADRPRTSPLLPALCLSLQSPEGRRRLRRRGSCPRAGVIPASPPLPRALDREQRAAPASDAWWRTNPATFTRLATSIILVLPRCQMSPYELPSVGPARLVGRRRAAGSIGGRMAAVGRGRRRRSKDRALERDAAADEPGRRGNRTPGSRDVPAECCLTNKPLQKPEAGRETSRRRTNGTCDPSGPEASNGQQDEPPGSP